jgi:ribulose-5-phosphate 4-epimerase/fuculose-1-phosphate aldolase
MSENISLVHQNELKRLRELSARIGSDLQLTQASTGNCSIKLGGVLWIKASGKWMADALNEEVLVPLALAEVQECLSRNVDPGERFAGASIETAMHAALLHRVVLHLHCVNTIAWAVRADAPLHLTNRLHGLPWQWIPYVPSGLPLARGIEKALSANPNSGIFVLGNHGLVIGAESCAAVETLLSTVGQRLSVSPRSPDQPDYAMLAEIADGSSWILPADNHVHALGNDPVSQAVLSPGLLFPCQSLFSNSNTLELFRSIPCPDPGDQWQSRYHDRPFLIIEGCGVIVKKTMTPAQHALLSGLAQVAQRIGASAPIRYLTEEEVTGSSGSVTSRYRETAGASRSSTL